MSDFHEKEERRSRRVRKCYCTGARIEIGDKYVRYFGVCEGDWYSYHVHGVAAPIYDRHNAWAWENDDCGLPFGDLLESLLFLLETKEGGIEARAVAELPGVPQWFIDRVNGKKEGGE